MTNRLRKSGIDIIGDIPWGTHFCQFYQTEDDLLNILVPYFVEGLQNNEFCMWVTAEPVDPEAAMRALARALPDAGRYLETGQIEIVPHTEWYLLGGTFDQERVLTAWVDKLTRARARGYDGLRLTGNTFWLEKADWNDFTEYEAAINRVIGNYHMIAICTYSLDKCGATEVADVVSNHQFALMKRSGEWSIIESADYKETREALRKERDFTSAVLDTVSALVVVVDSDGRIVNFNRACEQTIGYVLEQAKGRRFWDLFFAPHERASVRSAVEAVLDGKPEKGHEHHWLTRDGKRRLIAWSNAALRDARDSISHIICTGIDVTEQRLVEDALHEAYTREHHIADTLQKAIIPDVSLDLSTLQIAVAYHPVLQEAEVGGDFGDVFALRDGRIALAIGDVSGKGLQAAVHTVMAKYMLRAYAHEHADSAQVMQQVNKTMCEYLPEDVFITIFHGVLDPETCSVTYANAGHDAPLHYSHRAGCSISLDTTGRAVGLSEESRYATRAVNLAPGDVLLIYTDGITEAGAPGVLFGVEGLSKAIVDVAEFDAATIADAVFRAAYQAASGVLRDDVAILVIKALPQDARIDVCVAPKSRLQKLPRML